MSYIAAALPSQVSFFRPGRWANHFPDNEARFSIALWGTVRSRGAAEAIELREISRVALNVTNES
ncbi:hypothetical protein [Bradyrhizobium sp. USDA 4486]